MSNVEVNGTRLYYVESGAGAPVVLSHSYLVDDRQFDRQAEDLSDRYRVIAFYHRDHGRSAHADGPYKLATLVDDAAALIQAVGAVPSHWMGLSTGGFVGIRLAP